MTTGTGLPAAALALLDDIDRWVIASKSSTGQLGQMVLNHGGFVPLLRKRGSLKPETDIRIRAFMARFPDREALPPGLASKLVDEARVNQGWAPERHRSMMIRLGYPLHSSLEPIAASPMGGVAPAKAAPPEGKPRINAAVIRAAKLDGRDLPTFVTALIDMGLECWRDDRVEHGEAVA